MQKTTDVKNIFVCSPEFSAACLAEDDAGIRKASAEGRVYIGNPLTAALLAECRDELAGDEPLTAAQEGGGNEDCATKRKALVVKLNRLREYRCNLTNSTSRNVDLEYKILVLEKEIKALESPRVGKIVDELRQFNVDAFNSFPSQKIRDKLCKLTETELERVEVLMKERGCAFVVELLS